MTKRTNPISRRLLSMMSRDELESLINHDRRPWMMDRPTLINSALADWHQGTVESIMNKLVRQASMENGG